MHYRYPGMVCSPARNYPGNRMTGLDLSSRPPLTVSSFPLKLQPEMLHKLSIQNYAIIDELEIVFSPKLNSITGETGAGKSIIVGALGLILGQRADSSVLVNKERKCIVEGAFERKNDPAIHAFLEENDLDVQDEIVIRREINVNGKSRAFINDTPVTLAQLNALSALLVDMHQQFDTLEIGESDFQRQVIDALAGNNELLRQYRLVFGRWQQVRREYEQLKEQKALFDKEADYNQFQHNELEEAAFHENEIEEADSALKTLSHAEGIKAALNKVYYELEESDSPLVQQLKSLQGQLLPYTDYHADLPGLVQRLQATQVELKDIADEIDRVSSHIQYDPEKIELLNERLSLGYRLQKKHGVNSTAALLEIQASLEQKLQAVLGIDDAIRQKEQETAQLLEEVSRQARLLSAARKQQAAPLSDKVNELLVQVGMPNARLQVSVAEGQTAQDLTATGADTIEFLFDANRSNQFQPVRKVASGGELSRLMLCIKSLVAEHIDLPTLIFDEIDTGISGEAARQVGIILKKLAARRQVICITHQPQIAGKADAHFFVYKEAVGEAVRTGIRQLSTDERITAIARMLGGEKPTAAAIANAREMVSH